MAKRNRDYVPGAAIETRKVFKVFVPASVQYVIATSKNNAYSVLNEQAKPHDLMSGNKKIPQEVKKGKKACKGIDKAWRNAIPWGGKNTSRTTEYLEDFLCPKSKRR